MLFSNHAGIARKIYSRHYKIKQKIEDFEFQTFDFLVIANATENFSTKNKLGEGGFGPVYKVMNKKNIQKFYFSQELSNFSR